jgi:beta-galactosidase
MSDRGWFFPTLVYGGDYNPEQWSPEVWQEDVALMQQAGVNLVTLALFAWARLEPRPGDYDWDWLDQIMNLLHAHGIHVCLGTATPSPPPWLIKLHPDILPVTAAGVRLGPGSRRHYCPHSHAYRTYAVRLVTQIADRYGQHPALALWHVDNEYACHVSECFCDASAAAFRAWLETRYGTLDTLNESWGSAFWGQIYGEWNEIQPPRLAPTTINPAHQLDWQRFCSDSWLDCFCEQRDILRRITPHIPVTTNFISVYKPLDYWAWAAAEDLVSNDAYPDPSSATWMIDHALACDLMRGLAGGNAWLLMEQATGLVNWRSHNVTKRPDQMRLGSYQALARGANGIMFFQWRASKAGGEQFHSAMLPHAGTATRTWREVVELGNELRQLDVLLDTRTTADVAIMFDWHAWWALELEGKPTSDLTMIDQVRAFYAPLYERNITVDIVPPAADLSRYKLVLAPNLYLASAATAQNLVQFVERGGTILMGCFSGIVDERAQVGLGGYPALFRALLGLCIEEFAPHAADQVGTVHTVDGATFTTQIWGDIIRLEGAEAIARFADNWYAGLPAVTRRAYGNGMAYYIGTCLDADGISWLFDQVCAECNVQPVAALPPGIEAVRRTDDERTVLFLLNHTATAADLCLMGDAHDLVSGTQSNTIHLAPYGIAIVQQRQL